ncbi:MAG: Gfo/Idh/MocA family oxidoreductase [Defluviitaleaceae bacterium]|nr:Gfo/Idh/MocA family oxidoreductase [Defluviitaleaceae bacterium]
MQAKADGANYAPKGKAKPVVGLGEFKVGVVGLDHGHIFGMCNGLSEAGAEITMVYDKDPAKVEAFRKTFPGAAAVQSEEVIMQSDVRLVACASVPDERCGVGLRAMAHGKDYFADKPPLITREQLQQARDAVRSTGRKFGVYFSERLHVEASVYAGQLIAEGAIGRVLSVSGFGPHRLNAPSRPDWFFKPERYGGIITDIGCHQIEQILFFSGANDAKIMNSRIANYNLKEHPMFQDYGDATLVCSNGAAGYFRVDWFTPKGLGAWGDGRATVTGTDGYIELRKYIDVARDPEGDHVYMVNHEGEHHFNTAGKCGFPFFGLFIRDCLDGTELSMSQYHIFRVMELSLDAQESAIWMEGGKCWA